MRDAEDPDGGSCAGVMIGGGGRNGLLLIPLMLLSPFATLLVCGPGLYSGDAMNQLLQAVSHVYNDWHPPVMAWIWSLLLGLTGKIGSLFFVHLFLFGMGMLVWGRVFRHLRAGASAVFLALAMLDPVVVFYNGIVWKDVGLAITLFLGFGVVSLALVTGRFRRITAIVSLILAFYAVGVRANALPAVLFMVLLGCRACFGEGRRWRIAAAALLVSAGLVLANGVLSYGVLGASRTYQMQQVELYDLAGIARQAGVFPFPDASKSKDYSDDNVLAAYRTWTSNYLILDYDKPAPFAIRRDGGIVADLSRAWLSTVTSFPREYLRHRFAVFNSLMTVGVGPAFVDASGMRSAMNTFIRGNDGLSPYGEDAPLFSRYGALSALMNKALFAIGGGTFLLSGWFFMALLSACFCASFALRGPLSPMLRMVSLSGLVFIGLYFFAAPATDYRYMYWSIMAANLAAAMVMGACWHGLRHVLGKAKPPS